MSMAKGWGPSGPQPILYGLPKVTAYNSKGPITDPYNPHVSSRWQWVNPTKGSNLIHHRAHRTAPIILQGQ